jgi:hypothetical protein
VSFQLCTRDDISTLRGQARRPDRAPQFKLGFAVREMQRQGIATEQADLAQEIAARQEIADELQTVTRQPRQAAT